MAGVYADGSHKEHTSSSRSPIASTSTHSSTPLLGPGSPAITDGNDKGNTRRAVHAGAAAPRLPDRMDTATQRRALEEFRSVVAVGASKLRRFKQAAAGHEEEQRRRELRVAWVAEAESLAREAAAVGTQVDEALDSLSNDFLLLEATYAEEEEAVAEGEGEEKSELLDPPFGCSGNATGASVSKKRSIEQLTGANTMHNARLAFRRVINESVKMAEERQQVADDIKIPIGAARADSLALRKAVNAKTKQAKKESAAKNIAKAKKMLADTSLFPTPTSTAQLYTKNNTTVADASSNHESNQSQTALVPYVSPLHQDLYFRHFDEDLVTNTGANPQGTSSSASHMDIRNMVTTKMRSLRSAFGLLFGQTPDHFQHRIQRTNNAALTMRDGQLTKNAVHFTADENASSTVSLLSTPPHKHQEESCSAADHRICEHNRRMARDAVLEVLDENSRERIVQYIQNLVRQRQAVQTCRRLCVRNGLVDVVVHATDESVTRVRSIMERANGASGGPNHNSNTETVTQEVFITEGQHESTATFDENHDIKHKVAALSHGIKKHIRLVRNFQKDHAMNVCYPRLAPSALTAPRVYQAAVEAAAAFEEFVEQEAIKLEQSQQKYCGEVEAARQQFMDATATLEPSEIEAVVLLCRTYMKPSLLVGKGHGQPRGRGVHGAKPHAHGGRLVDLTVGAGLNRPWRKTLAERIALQLAVSSGSSALRGPQHDSRLHIAAAVAGCWQHWHAVKIMEQEARRRALQRAASQVAAASELMGEMKLAALEAAENDAVAEREAVKAAYLEAEREEQRRLGIKRLTAAQEAQALAAEKERIRAALLTARQEARRAQIRSAAATFATQRDDQLAAAKRAEAAAADKAKQAFMEAAPQRLGRIQHREDLYQEKRRKMLDERHRQEIEQEAAEERLMQFFACREEQIGVQRDAHRAIAPTAASIAAADPDGSRVVPLNEQAAAHGITTMRGFSDDKISRDPRTRVMAALRDAGLHSTDYAQSVLSNMSAPKPHLSNSIPNLL